MIYSAIPHSSRLLLPHIPIFLILFFPFCPENLNTTFTLVQAFCCQLAEFKSSLLQDISWPPVRPLTSGLSSISRFQISHKHFLATKRSIIFLSRCKMCSCIFRVFCCVKQQFNKENLVRWKKIIFRFRIKVFFLKPDLSDLSILSDLTWWW